MHEPSDTTPDLSNDTEAVICENCGSSLSPMEWETLDNKETVNDAGDTGYGAALHSAARSVSPSGRQVGSSRGPTESFGTVGLGGRSSIEARGVKTERKRRARTIPQEQ